MKLFDLLGCVELLFSLLVLTALVASLVESYLWQYQVLLLIVQGTSSSSSSSSYSICGNTTVLLLIVLGMSKVYNRCPLLVDTK